MNTTPLVALKARYIFPGEGPPLRDAMLTCDAQGVRSLGSTTAAADVQDLGNAAIIPGLFNAHTHFELSGFEQPLGDPAQGFPAWIGEVVTWRREQFEQLSADQRFAQRQQAVERGILESAAAGVTSVADIVSPGWSEALDAGPSMLLQPFQEVLGLRTNRADELFASAEQFLDRYPHAGISPHAPYTVGVELLERLVRLAQQRNAPLAMHLAESADELELLRSHSGAFFSLLTEFDAWDPSAFPRGIAPLEYLKLLAQAPRALVIHGNYLSDEEIGFLGAHADRLTVVYCPRTHAYFGHPRYPLVEMLQRGVRVALGTDSRASNPDLNLWNELRYVADTFPELPLDTIFRLGLDPRQPLQVGASPRFVVVDLPEEDAADPYELLFDARSQVRLPWPAFLPR